MLTSVDEFILSWFLVLNVVFRYGCRTPSVALFDVFLALPAVDSFLLEIYTVLLFSMFLTGPFLGIFLTKPGL